MMQNQATAQEITTIGRVIIKIIKNDLAGNSYLLPADVDFKKLYMLADMHRVVPLIAEAVLNCPNAPDEVKKKFKSELFKVSMRYEAQLKEKKKLSALFSEANIKHCFLKGDKLSRFYKNPELRFMLDMDVYVEENGFKRAEEILQEQGYELNSFADDKDVGYIKKPFYNVELHRELKYDYDKGYDYYKGAFSRLQGVEGSCELNMTDEDFYVYILSHTAHHFETAGTGIRNVLDHYYLKNKLMPNCNYAVLEAGLEAVGLTAFAQRMDALAEAWFGNGECNEDIEEISDYILLGGVFGNKVNHYMGGILRGDYGDKKSSFILKRLFPSRAKMQDRYPVLKRFAFLLPVIWVVRIVSALFSKKDYSAEIDNADSVTQEQKEAFARFMQKNGL